MEVAKPSVTGAVSNGLTEAGLAVKHRLHGAVLGKDTVPRRPVPIHLGVKVVAIQFLGSRLGIVVGVAARCRGGNQSYDFLGDRVDASGGDHVGAAGCVSAGGIKVGASGI